MKVFLGVTLAVAVIALAVSLFVCFNLSAENQALTEELSSTNTTLALTQDELETTQAQLAISEKALASSETSLAERTSELDETKEELLSTKAVLSTSRTKIASLEQSVSDAQAQTAAAQAQTAAVQLQLDRAEQTLRGLGITVAASALNRDAEMVDNAEAKDPTLAELKAFLVQDMTEHNQYILHEYDCSEFSRDIHNGAEAAGIRGAVVHVDLRNSTYGHALNAFLTTDYGLVYIDCTEAPDRIARVQNGKTYRSESVNAVPPGSIRTNTWWDNLWSYYYLPDDFGREAISDAIKIFW